VIRFPLTYGIVPFIYQNNLNPSLHAQVGLVNVWFGLASYRKLQQIQSSH